MGEGVLRHKFDQAGLSHIDIISAGTSGWNNCKPISDAIIACKEIGIDISVLRSTPLSEGMIQEADFVVAMEKFHINEMIHNFNAPAEKLLLFGMFHPDNPGMDIQDPYGMSLNFYREILVNICLCSDGLINNFLNNSKKNGIK